jgi:hypothetical protein
LWPFAFVPFSFLEPETAPKYPIEMNESLGFSFSKGIDAFREPVTQEILGARKVFHTC